MPTVSAVILNYRRPDQTEHCVRSLLRQTPSLLEIIIVDNDSGNDSRGRLSLLQQKFPENVRFIEAPENLGYGRGNALGIAHARGEYLLIVNPDTEPEPPALQTMVAYLETHPDTGIVGPQLVHPNGTIRDSYRTFPTATDLIIKRTPLRYFFKARMRRYLQWDRSPFETRDVDWLVGACLLMRRDFYASLGGFDPRFFLFLEDTDLCRRCWESGKRVVYLSDAKARDRFARLSAGGPASLLTKRAVRIHTASAMKYFWKWRGKPLPQR
jgi:GT2 family glycosyltransferase